MYKLKNFRSDQYCPEGVWPMNFFQIEMIARLDSIFVIKNNFLWYMNGTGSIPDYNALTPLFV